MLAKFLRLIKLSHTVFVLPFVLVAFILILETIYIPLNWLKIFEDLFWIVVAFIGMRAFAMIFNRIVDRKIDKKNPRTTQREIPAGEVSIFSAIILGSFFLIMVWVSSLHFDIIIFWLTFPVIFLLAGYSYSKRFTWLCHFWLGAMVGLAPIGASLAFIEGVQFITWILFFIVATYIAGSDILYSLQDIDFDRENRLHSIPARFGLNGAVWISFGIHCLTGVFLFALAVFSPLGIFYILGSTLLIVLLVLKHLFIGFGDSIRLDKVSKVFFPVNSVFSIAFFMIVFIDQIIRGVFINFFIDFYKEIF